MGRAGVFMLCVLVTAFMAGCGPRVEVKSTTSWSGAVGGTSGKNGVRSVGPYTGNHTFEGDDCGTFQKDTVGGSLTAKVIYKGLFTRDGEKASTSSAYGVVSVCGGG